MAFTTAEVANIANAALDYYLNRGDTFKQSLQAKPLLRAMESGGKSFPGGKRDISLAVKGDYGAGGTNDKLAAYTHSDQVNFYNPANIKRVNYPWIELHLGLTVTNTELKVDGLSVVDSDNMGSTRGHSQREKTVLVNLLRDKLDDFSEQYARSQNELLWGDGSATNAIPANANVAGAPGSVGTGATAGAFLGIRSFITDDPTTGTVGGINRATSAWWRNRSLVGTNAITSSPQNGGALAQALQNEWRQLIRYGGKPNLALAGSDFIDALEIEMRANGYYTDSGFTGGGDMAMGGIKFKGLNIQYDPTLDDMSMEKRCYMIDTSSIYLMKMDGEWRRTHNPPRTHDHFVYYRSITNTGQLVAQRCNSSAVYEIA